MDEPLNDGQDELGVLREREAHSDQEVELVVEVGLPVGEIAGHASGREQGNVPEFQHPRDRCCVRGNKPICFHSVSCWSHD